MNNTGGIFTIICFTSAVRKSLLNSLGDRSSILVSPLLTEVRKLWRPSLKHLYMCISPSVVLTVKLQTSFVRHREDNIVVWQVGEGHVVISSSALFSLSVLLHTTQDFAVLILTPIN